jgi:hypothetical protein
MLKYVLYALITLAGFPAWSQTGLGDQLPDESKDEIQQAYVVLEPMVINPGTIYEHNDAARREYRRKRYHVLKVYPYALRSLELMEEMEIVAADMDRKKDRRKYRKKLEKQLKEEFKDELKKLSKTQGNILVDMIERHTDRAFYEILKDLKSGTTAFFWQSIGKKYGYDLKHGYQPEEDPVLEEILSGLQWPDYIPGEDIMP